MKINKMKKQEKIKQEVKMEEKKEEEKSEKINKKEECSDVKCPFHGQLSLRGRFFRGTVMKKFPKRVVIEFERTLYIRKFERYAKSKIKLHAHLPDCLANEVNVGDYVEINECRKLSKIISFVVVKKLRAKSGRARTT